MSGFAKPTNEEGMICNSTRLCFLIGGGVSHIYI